MGRGVILPGLGRKAGLGAGALVQRRPLGWAGEEGDGQLADQHRRGFEVDALVVEAHEQRPKGVAHADGRVAVGEVGVGLDELADGGVDLLAIGVGLGKAGPQHLVLGHVVPAHLVHAGLEDALEVGVEGRRDQPGHPQLVDVERRRMTVVEDHRVAQVVVGRAVEGFLALQGGEEDLGERPAVVEGGQHLGPATGGQVGGGQRGEAAVRPAARAVGRGEAGPPPVGAGAAQQRVVFAAHVLAPGFDGGGQGGFEVRLGHAAISGKTGRCCGFDRLRRHSGWRGGLSQIVRPAPAGCRRRGAARRGGSGCLPSPPAGGCAG